MSAKAELLRAYRATSYCVHTPDGVLQLRVGERSAELDTLLQARGYQCGVFISAENPQSVALCAAENQARSENLLRAIAQSGYDYFPALGEPDKPNWPPEASVLLLGLSKLDGLVWANRFDQAAFLFIAIDQPIELVWVD